MQSGCRTPALLLLLVVKMMVMMMSAVTQAQSGSNDHEIEPRISCTSHISTGTCTLTCNVVAEESDSEDDEDDEADAIEDMQACYADLDSRVNCVLSSGGTINFMELSPIIVLDVTFSLKRGCTVKKMINLRKIVKPRSPQVGNVTFHREPYQAVIRVRTPYENDYLTMKQLFQLQIWNSTYNMLQNISLDKITIDEAHLRKNAKYHVRVRAIPQDPLQGTWSDWSEAYNFSTPAGKRKFINSSTQQMQDLSFQSGKIANVKSLWESYSLVVCPILILVVIFSIILSWKNKIFTYMWPNIPQPKHTLVQICNPNTGLLLNVKPDEYSVLKVYSMEKKAGEPDEALEPLDAGVDGLSLPCSSQSSDSSTSAHSVSTEDLELSAVLSRSSSDEEESLRSAAPSPVDAPAMPEPEREGEGKGIVCGRKQEEGYVTMSSFHQINKPVQKQ